MISNPFNLFCPYQHAWMRDASGIKLAEKSRRIGWTYADAFDATMSSNWSTFILTDANTGRFAGVTIYEEVQAGNEKGNDNFSLGHIRYAAAAAATRNMVFAEPPSPWFSVGIAAYCERYWNPIGKASDHKAIAKWTLDTLMKEGGKIDLKSYFDPFQGTRQSILQAGAVVGFLIDGQNKPKKVEEQWAKVRAGLAKPKDKGLLKDFLKLETLLGKDADKEFDAYIAAIQG